MTFGYKKKARLVSDVFCIEVPLFSYILRGVCRVRRLRSWLENNFAFSMVKRTYAVSRSTFCRGCSGRLGFLSFAGTLRKSIHLFSALSPQFLTRVCMSLQCIGLVFRAYPVLSRTAAVLSMVVSLYSSHTLTLSLRRIAFPLADIFVHDSQFLILSHTFIHSKSLDMRPC